MNNARRVAGSKGDILVGVRALKKMKSSRVLLVAFAVNWLDGEDSLRPFKLTKV